MTTTRLQEGHVYRLVYKLQSGNGQWFKYEATMTYLGSQKQWPGDDTRGRRTMWNLRPHFGTQELPLNYILEAHDLGKTSGREDVRHKPKRRLERIPKVED